MTKLDKQNQTNQNQVNPPDPLAGGDEDSVAQDISKFKSFVQKITGQAKTSAKPIVQKAKPIAQSVSSPEVKEKANKAMSSFTKVAMFAVIIFVTLLLIVIAFTIMKKFNQESEPGEDVGVERENGEIVYPTQSITPYKPTSPSIYASDTHILKLEEDIKILESEMFSIPVKESTLIPPSLDFNINFGEKKR